MAVSQPETDEIQGLTVTYIPASAMPLPTFIKNLESNIVEVEKSVKEYITEDTPSALSVGLILKKVKSRFAEAINIAGIGMNNERALHAFKPHTSSLHKGYDNYINELIPQYREYIQTLKTLFDNANNVFQVLHLYKTWEQSHQIILDLFKDNQTLIVHYPMIYLEMARCCIESLTALHKQLKPEDPFLSYIFHFENGIFRKIKSYFTEHNAIAEKIVYDEEQRKSLQERYESIAEKHEQYKSAAQKQDEDAKQDAERLETLKAIRIFDELFSKLKWITELLFNKMYEHYINPFLADDSVLQSAKFLTMIDGLQKLYAVGLSEIHTLRGYIDIFLAKQSEKSSISSMLKEYQRVCFKTSAFLNDKKVFIHLNQGSVFLLPYPKADDTKQNESEMHWSTLSITGSALLAKCQKLLKNVSTSNQAFLDGIKEIDDFSKKISEQAEICTFDQKKLKKFKILLNNKRAELILKADAKQADVDTLMKDIGKSDCSKPKGTKDRNSAAAKKAKAKKFANKVARNRIQSERRAKEKHNARLTNHQTNQQKPEPKKLAALSNASPTISTPAAPATTLTVTTTQTTQADQAPNHNATTDKSKKKFKFNPFAAPFKPSSSAVLTQYLNHMNRVTTSAEQDVKVLQGVTHVRT